MRTIKKIFGVGLIAFLLMLAAPHKAKAQDDYISDQEFYDDLAPYGTWVDDAQYGNVWVPDVNEDFRPYATNGYWAQTDYGSTWVSNYPWGWATFHYGRWRYDDYYGWEWIPGHEWAPAWVSWRHGGGYYGWAPLSPGISVTLSFGNSYRVPDNYWVCAPERYINRPNIYNYYVRPAIVINIIRKTVIIRNTHVYNNRTYIIGPRVVDIRRVTRQPVQVYRVNNSNRAGTVNINITNKTINIFRPAVRKAPEARPVRVVDAAAYKRENPHAGIGGNIKVGVVYNHGNANKLAQAARSDKPDTRIVKVDAEKERKAQQFKDNKPGDNKPNQPGNDHQKPAAGDNKPNQPGGRDHQKPAVGDNKPNQPAGNDRQKPVVGDNKPNQPADRDHQKPAVDDNKPNPAGGRGHKAPGVGGVTPPANNDQQKAVADKDRQGQPVQHDKTGRKQEPAVISPAQNDQKAAEQQAKEQAKEQQKQANQQAKDQAKEQQKQQVLQQREQQKQADQQAKQQARDQQKQADQQAKDQAKEQQKQQILQQREQQKQADQQAKQQARDQQKQADQQAQQQAKEQARQQVLQQREQQKQQQQQAQQQAKQQAQLQKQQAQQQAKAQAQQAREQAKQQAAEAKKQKEQTPPM